MLAAGIAVLRFREIPREIVILAFLGLVYLGGSSLPSGLPRHFVVITPLFWLVVATVLSRTVKVSWKERLP